MARFGLFLAAAFFVSTAALAASWDVSGDGVIDANKVATLLDARKAAFKTIDRNGDGYIDIRELAARLGGRVEEATVVLKFVIDNNFDGRIDPGEWAEADEMHVKNTIVMCDADKDGVLRGNEIRCAQSQPWW